MTAKKGRHYPPMHYVGGFNITKIEEAGRNAVAVTFEHSYADDVRFQLYQNRTLIGSTSTREETRIIGAYPPGASAAPLGIIVVDPANVGTDFSRYLDRRPWNEYELAFDPPDDPPADLHHFDVVASTQADAALDESNIVSRLPFVADRPDYRYTLPTFPASGEWAVALITRDNAQPSGNAGDPIEAAVVALVYPLDFVPITTGPRPRRFAYTLTGGVLSIESTIATVPSYP